VKWRDAVRITYGLVLVVAPDRAARVLTRVPLNQRARLVARILGVHHLTAALLVLTVEGRVAADQTHRAGWSARTGQVRTGSPDAIRRLSRGADVVHALSMVTLAAADPARRRLALTDAGVAALFSRDVPARTPPATPATSAAEGGLSSRASRVPLASTPIRPRSRRSSRPHPQPSEPNAGPGVQPGAVQVGPVASDPVAGDEGSGPDPARRLAPEIGAAARRRREARRQQAIRDVLPVSPGLAVRQIKSVLREALAIRGVGPQPEAWLAAVASDAALGNVYVVSEQAMADTGDVLPRATDEGDRTGGNGRDVEPK